ncbi:MAG: hypothetical protein J7M27_12940 [Candidatus Latescibacteria bacterium]|nr:hypothetical protein [Candidatus Latescibacterota bacterium]
MKNETERSYAMSEPLPAFLAPFFWEIDFARLRLAGRERYIIERLLEYGDDRAIRWLKTTFSPEAIGRVVRRSRCLSRNTANLWGLVLNIPREEMACFSTPSILPHGSFSSD